MCSLCRLYLYMVAGGILHTITLCTLREVVISPYAVCLSLISYKENLCAPWRHTAKEPRACQTPNERGGQRVGKSAKSRLSRPIIIICQTNYDRTMRHLRLRVGRDVCARCAVRTCATCALHLESGGDYLTQHPAGGEEGALRGGRRRTTNLGSARVRGTLRCKGGQLKSVRGKGLMCNGRRTLNPAGSAPAGESTYE